MQYDNENVFEQPNDPNIHRKKLKIQKIEKSIEMSENHTFDMELISAACAFAIGLGVLGIGYFGSNIIKDFISENTLTLKSYMTIRFKDVMFFASIMATITGAIGACLAFPEVISSKKNLKMLREELAAAIDDLKFQEENGKSR